MSSKANIGRVELALAALSGRRALLVGDHVLDAYVYGETVRVSREAPVLVVRKERSDYRLGGAANTAANLAALGVTTTVVGAVAEDEAGRKLRSMLGAAGVDVSGLHSCSATTAVKTRILAGAFGTSRQQILRIDEEPDGALPDETLRAVADILRRGAERADVIVVSDYGQGVVRGPVIEAVRDLAGAGRAVCVDSRYQLAAFTGCAAITPNVPEAEALVGFSLATADAVERAGRKLLAMVGCEACLITQGRHGMSLFVAGEPTAHVDIVGEEEVTDVTGAGDTVMATFSAALAAGIGVRNGMRLANCAAGVVVTKAGTATASPEEILAAAARYGLELEPWDASST